MEGTQRSRVWRVHRGAGYGGYTAMLHHQTYIMTHDGVAAEHPHAGHVVSVRLGYVHAGV